MTRTSGEQLGYEWSRWAPFSSPNPAAPVITPLLPSATLRLVLSLSAPDINSSRASHQAGQNSATTTAFLVVVAQVPERNGTIDIFFLFFFPLSLYSFSFSLGPPLQTGHSQYKQRLSIRLHSESSRKKWAVVGANVVQKEDEKPTR